MAKASGFVFFFTSDRLNDFDGALPSGAVTIDISRLSVSLALG
jgi:uncharacterized protein (DUF2252 family)